MPDFRRLLMEGREKLAEAGVADSSTDAWLLMEHVFGITRTQYFMKEDQIPGEEETAEYLELIKKRAARIPLQHLTHEAWFYGLRFFVNEHVLIPRQDTEVLVEEIINAVSDKDKPLAVLDMCTGSGCILLALMSVLTHAEGTGVDLSAEALKVAEKNAEELNLQAKWIQSDLFSKISKKYDIIVSNPPYIESGVIEELMEEVRDHEPRMALDGMEDGLYFYRKLSREADGYLNPEGILAFEIGYDQGPAVSTMLEEAGYTEVRTVKDLAGLDRVVIGRRKQEEPHV